MVSSARAIRSRGRPTKDRTIRSTKAKSSEATATAIEVPALTSPTYAIATCRFSYVSRLANVYSPRTTATESKHALRIALDIFGTMTRSITVPHPAHRLRAASDSVLMSIAASSSEAMIASTRSGVLMMLVHASMVRGAVTLLPRVENSNIAAIGTRKNTPMARKTAERKTCSLMRRDRFIRFSPQPSRCPPLKQRVKQHHDGDDRDHRQRECLGESGLRLPGLAGEQVADLERHDDPSLCKQHRCRRVSGEGVREQEQRAAEERRRQEWRRDIAPVVPGTAAETLGRLAPLRTDAVERRQEHEHHQRDLEVCVDQGQAAELVQPHAIRKDVDSMVLQEHSDNAHGPQRRDECEDQRYASEL